MLNANRKYYYYRWTTILINHLVKIFFSIDISLGRSATETTEVQIQQLLQEGIILFILPWRQWVLPLRVTQQMV